MASPTRPVRFTMLEPKGPTHAPAGSDKWPVTELVHAGGFTLLAGVADPPPAVDLTIRIDGPGNPLGADRVDAIREAVTRLLPAGTRLSVTVSRLDRAS